MAKPVTRQQFKTYCLRRLGFPVIQINVDDDQVEDRIDDALQFFQDYHFDGTEKIYMKHMITAEDINRRWIYCPDAVTFVTGVLPFDDSNSSINMFDLRYQLRLHDLYDFTSVSYVSYEITMQHIRTLQLLFSGTPQFRFNRKLNKIFLTLTGTVDATTTANTVSGTGTIFDQELLENDIITIGSENKQIKRISSPTSLELYSPVASPITGGTLTVAGVSDVWDDKVLKRYGTALIKRQWGENLKKFGGIQMPGGVMLNGKEIWDEAQTEIDKIEEEIYNYNSLPSEIFTG